MLIKPSGDALWQKTVDPEPKKKKKRFANQERKTPPPQEDLRGIFERGWKLPQTFCVDCEKNGVMSDHADIWMLEEKRQDLHLDALDIVLSYVCESCVTQYKILERDKTPLYGPDGKAIPDERLIALFTARRKVAIEWIHGAILRGDKPFSLKGR